MPKIVVTFENPPVPDRGFDYRARFARFDADDTQPEGWGATEDAAKADLLTQAGDED